MVHTQLDLIGLGECLVEFHQTGHTHYELSFAGDVLNALFYASRIGLRTGLMSCLGSDPFSSDLEALFVKEGIDYRSVRRLEDRPNGVYFVLRTGKPKPDFFFLRKSSAATQTFVVNEIKTLADYAQQGKALLFSSIPLSTMEHSERIKELLEAIQGKVKIYFDVNYRPALWSKSAKLSEWIEWLGGVVDGLFITNDDDEALFGRRTEEEAMDYFGSLGFTEIVFRRGDQPTLFWRQGASYEMPVAHNLNVIDTTGAGDAFNAGYISAKLEGRNDEECLAMGNAVAAVAIEAQGGLNRAFVSERANRFYHEILRKQAAEHA